MGEKKNKSPASFSKWLFYFADFLDLHLRAFLLLLYSGPGLLQFGD